MARPNGLPKTGGRQKGTPNKRTLFFQEALEKEGFDAVSNLVRLLPQLSIDKQADTILEIMSYIYPKRKAVEQLVHGAIEHQSMISIQDRAAEMSIEDVQAKLARYEKMQERFFQKKSFSKAEPSIQPEDLAN